jgi:hypothetical protein
MFEVDVEIWMWWHSLFLKVIASKLVGERMFKTKNELKIQSKKNNA